MEATPVLVVELMPLRGHRTLVVGGIARFIDQVIAPRLHTYGCDVTEHWDMTRLANKAAVDLPKNIDAVVALVDMIPGGHNLVPLIRAQAQERGLKFVASQRKWSVLSTDLKAAGFTERTIRAGDAPSAVDAADELLEKWSKDDDNAAWAALSEELGERNGLIEHQQRVIDTRNGEIERLTAAVEEARRVATSLRAQLETAQKSGGDLFNTDLLPAATWDERQNVLRALLRSLAADGLESLSWTKAGGLKVRRVLVTETEEHL